MITHSDTFYELRKTTDTYQHIILADALRKMAACPVNRTNTPDEMGQALYTMRVYAKAALRECGIKE